jgi:hypothetical protein
VDVGVSEAVQLKAAAALVHQTPATDYGFPTLSTALMRLGIQEAWHFDAGAEWKVAPWLELSASAYYDVLTHLIELGIADREFDPAPPGTIYVGPFGGVPSRGIAYGGTVFLRHPIGDRWFGWLSYSYQRALREVPYYRHNEFGEPVELVRGLLPFPYEQVHLINGVVGYKFDNNWTVGLTAHFNTGTPENGGPHSTTASPGVDRSGRPVWLPTDKDQALRMPSYFRLDARVARSWALENFILEASLDFFNVAFTQETFGYDYPVNTDPDTGQVTLGERKPISFLFFLPMLGVKASY